MFLIPFACSVNSRVGATPMQANWIELDQGSTIDGELKLATQLPKGNINNLVIKKIYTQGG